MAELPESELNRVLATIRNHVDEEQVRITRHANEEMVEEEITIDQVFSAISNSAILEYYSEHKRGPCCLLSGKTQNGRWLHVVCTTALPVLVIITVYEPKSPRWVTPVRRGKKS